MPKTTRRFPELVLNFSGELLWAFKENVDLSELYCCLLRLLVVSDLVGGSI